MIRVGAAQVPDVQGSIPDTISVMKSSIAKALQEDVSLLCFPECYLQGYTREASSARTRALSLKEPAFLQLCEELSFPHICLIIGMIEIQDGHLYNTAVVLREGRLLGAYRKTYPQEGIFQAGTQYPIVTIDGIRVGMNICYDANFPEAAGALGVQGVDLICCLLNNLLPHDVALRWKDRHLENLTARARETAAWILSADVIGHSETHHSYGHTALVNPEGQLLSQIAEDTEGILIHELPL